MRTIFLAVAFALLSAHAYALHSAHSDVWEQPGVEQERWSQKNIEAICSAHFQKMGQAYNGCMARSQRRLGKIITPGDRQELDKVGAEITTKEEKPETTKKKIIIQ